jgi:hypothetical protein
MYFSQELHVSFMTVHEFYTCETSPDMFTSLSHVNASQNYSRELDHIHNTGMNLHSPFTNPLYGIFTGPHYEISPDTQTCISKSRSHVHMYINFIKSSQEIQVPFTTWPCKLHEHFRIQECLMKISSCYLVHMHMIKQHTQTGKCCTAKRKIFSPAKNGPVPICRLRLTVAPQFHHLKHVSFPQKDHWRWMMISQLEL